MGLLPNYPSCAPYGSEPYDQYGYQPSLVAGIIFSIIFGSIALSQLFFVFRTRAWWMLFFVIGASLECMGWIARTVAHNCSYSDTLSTMQVATLIMGPAWTQVGVYLTSYVLISKVFGKDVSPIAPAVYIWIIFWVDTICLSLQAIGGGIAGASVTSGSSPTTGTHIMVAGIIAQLVSGCGFAVYLAIIIPRAFDKIKASKQLTFVCIGMILSTTMMTLRGFYRSVELSQGWTGYLITHQAFVIALDASPMVVAMLGLVVTNPGVLLLQYGLTRQDCQVYTFKRNSKQSMAETKMVDEEMAEASDSS